MAIVLLKLILTKEFSTNSKTFFECKYVGCVQKQSKTRSVCLCSSVKFKSRYVVQSWCNMCVHKPKNYDQLSHMLVISDARHTSHNTVMISIYDAASKDCRPLICEGKQTVSVK